VVSELQSQVRNLGGKTEDDESILASAHRVLVNFRDSLSNGDKGVIAEVHGARISSR
jgi:uncharacterized protein (TIGR02284 family)